MKEKLFMVILVILTTISAFAQGNATYPRSEWDYARSILMHTPGEELFDGVIHPYAGLC